MADAQFHTVFLSYSPHDEELASRVKQRLADGGLTVQSVRPTTTGDVSEAVREAIAGCEVVIVLATEAFLPSTNLAVEVGAAIAWKKPIYVLTKDVRPSDLPGYLSSAKVFSVDQIDPAIEAIRRDRLDLTPEQGEWLKGWSSETRVPPDQLITHPPLLADLADKFQKAWKRTVVPERLVRELLKLRTQGKLTADRKKGTA